MQLFYWDYAIGLFVLSLVLAFTMGSMGKGGMGFLENVSQATVNTMLLALLGGVIFNLANILLVGAIDIAGMAVVFPIGVGLAMVIGVINNYIANPIGNAVMLFVGVGCVVLAIICDGLAYKRLLGHSEKTAFKVIVMSVIGGVLMGWFYRFAVASMSMDFMTIEAGKFTPYSAVVFFSAGILLSNFLFNSISMAKPFRGDVVKYRDYFKGGRKTHLIGMLGGFIWVTGMSFNVIASGTAGPAISYGLGQGATMVAVIWGVFIWKEFKEAPAGTNKLLALMFALYMTGLGLIIAARLA